MSGKLEAAVAAALRRDEAAFLNAGRAFAAGEPEAPTAWRRIALALNGAGQPVWAARAQQECIRLSRGKPGFRPDDEAFLGDLLLRGGRLNLARDVLKDLTRRHPDFVPGLMLLAATWASAARFEEALALYRRVLERQPDHVQALDGVARAAGWQGEREEALRAGRRALELKDKAVTAGKPVWSLKDARVPPFDPRARKRNVIAFSLWGDAPRYVETAVHNARIAPEIYPSWHCRFYCDDTVPQDVRQQLTTLGATVIMKARPPMRHGSLFWRFLAAEDPGIDRFLVRDADSLLNVRERVAVDDWLLSGRPFHAMRDWWSHTELLLAGMWGGCGGLLCDLSGQVERYFQRPEVANRALDQGFLAQVVWPSIRDHCLIHDDIFGSLGARPFPPLGRLPQGEHVGMNARGYDEARRR